MNRTVVLLSTYNGEKYIKEQIESILNQDRIEVDIMIRDDGSKDQTIKILKGFQDDRIFLYTGENIGYAKSFMWLLDKAYREKKYSYFSFCDQDDIWDVKKLYTAIDKLDHKFEEKPQLYFSNLLITNSNGEVIGKKTFHDRSFSFGSALIRSNIAGCTMLFNEKLVEKVLKDCSFYKLDLSHDSWVYKVAWAVNANIVYDEESYIKFRRHEDTVTNLKRGVSKRIKTEWKKTFREKGNIQSYSKVLLETYSEEVSLSNKSILKDIINYKSSVYKKINLIKNKQIRTSNLTLDLLTLFKIVFNLL